MNKQVCKKFQDITENLEYDSINKKLKFKDDDIFKEYCTGEKSDDNRDIKCDEDTDKINVACLFLFDKLFGSYESFNSVAKKNTNIVDYILIWLRYMLNFNKIQENDTIKHFYEIYINSGKKYNQKINEVTVYQSYKDLIDKKQNLMSIGIIDISKFFHAFVLLCDMYIEVNEESSNCNIISNLAKDFAIKYDELNEDYNNGKDGPYNQLLSTLSNDYCNLKNKCNQFPTLPTYSRRFVIKRTLIPIAFMIVALSIFLGIEYKVNNKSIKQYIHH
ncbi:putative yir3 protein [Plasmodium yoelii yoelii]|uniref:Yir3 protein n=1 Tax=Plasmodium yoelii yoelii TaxID=73239 RepID=Q7R7G8_PLAYO|nr:putative yir3 protein [Plasmodium yoelii yoelii]